ncbi:Kielin/chordin-like protein [Lamellibrachia satsuma]|nr:Kielin/chordin-like protein [Lamellibrachia satsuma]
MSRENKCEDCRCEAGEVNCKARSCPPHSCQHPTLNRCCPLCRDCNYRNKLYRHNEKFVSPDESCQNCRCQAGTVTCHPQPCPPLDCRTPTKVPGSCCPVCGPEGCQYLDRRYFEGEVFTSHENECEDCRCEAGEVHCKARSCPPHSCQHPAVDRCCPVCRECDYRDKLYRHTEKFVSPDDTCQNCQCQAGTVTCHPQPCPPLDCRTPTKVPGSCCPVCGPEGCQYLDRRYFEGEMFTSRENECEDCHCEAGEVHCKARSCPPHSCQHPALDRCCPVCRECDYRDKLYRHNEKFVSPDDSCQNCQCQAGTVTCHPQACPSLDCRTPTKVPGSCCPVCGPEGCQYLGRRYFDGELFMSRENKCEDCRCEAGEVHCKARSCPPHSCQHPALNRCCPVCRDCDYRDKFYRHNEKFVSPDDLCQNCQCQAGTVTCHPQPCPPLDCHTTTKVPGSCCPVCGPEGCQYLGRQYFDGEMFTSRENECEDCRCEAGEVHCRARSCPPHSCQHPALNRCCPLCRDCDYHDKLYRHNEKFVSPNDVCQNCQCRGGTVTCRPMDCRAPICRTPKRVPGKCCSVCEREGCEYRGRLYDAGQVFSPPEQMCDDCLCQDSQVKCSPRRCPPALCDYPIQTECCLQCTGCQYKGLSYSNLEIFFSPDNVCEECTCVEGFVTCHPRPCYDVPCLHPAKNPGECCPSCLNCFYAGALHEDKLRFVSTANPCVTCMCEAGTVTCERNVCPPPACSHPAEGDCCPTCDLCLYSSQRYRDGQHFLNILDVCEECACRHGNVTCWKRECSPVTCSHPVEGHCCPECTDCLYSGQRMSDGSQFTDKTNKCQICECEMGNVGCKRRPCPEIKCINPVQGECCMECRRGCLNDDKRLQEGDVVPHPKDPCMECVCQDGEMQCFRKKCQHATCSHPAQDPCGCPLCHSCFFEGQEVGHGNRVTRQDDPCETCTCLDGNIACEEVICPAVVCTKPVYMPGQCCARCSDCEFSKQRYMENSSFSHPDDICQHCQCLAGEVRCQRKKCPETATCSHPVPGRCCPLCDRCMYQGKVYQNQQHFNPDPCVECACQDGNVECSEIRCPVLTCPRPQKVEGVCCPTCGGCIYEGREHQDGTNWVSTENPCISCYCQGGVTLCTDLTLNCITPCQQPAKLPGLCCPVCPGCTHSGVTYKSGDVFSPTGDTCDMCTCQDGNLVCQRQSCPTTVLCPQSALVPATKQACCPTCTEVHTRCTRDQVGLIVRPKDDPCYMCECKSEYNWLCMREVCPLLDCNLKDQVLTPGECCPHCRSCLLADEAIWLKSGDTWRSPLEPCLTCLCEDGLVSCNRLTCPKLQCADGLAEYQTDGDCCAKCVSRDLLACNYEGKTYQAGENFTVDVCTTCKCIGLEMKCHTKKCVRPECNSEEIPSLVPGICCPKCILKPATCIGYGDPHYRTFDGALVHMQGMCKYVMSADCKNDDFSVEVQHHDLDGGGIVSWVESVTLKLGKLTVDLGQGGTVKVNNVTVTLPYLNEPVLSIELSADTVILNTNIGLGILWDQESRVEVSLSGSYKERVCGLCGNFNQFPQDDMTTKTGRIVASAATFGNSWRVVTDRYCADAEDVDPCSAAGYRMRKLANTKCAVLKSKLFQPCHRLISPQPYYASCVYDMCVCGDSESCLCNVLETYALQCSKAGVALRWRSASLCAIGCAEDKGFLFDECGPPCARTCANKDMPISALAEQCFKPCVPGCQCPAQLVLYNDQCIPPDECP